VGSVSIPIEGVDGSLGLYFEEEFLEVGHKLLSGVGCRVTALGKKLNAHIEP